MSAQDYGYVPDEQWRRITRQWTDRDRSGEGNGGVARGPSRALTREQFDAAIRKGRQRAIYGRAGPGVPEASGVQIVNHAPNTQVGARYMRASDAKDAPYHDRQAGADGIDVRMSDAARRQRIRQGAANAVTGIPDVGGEAVVGNQGYVSAAAMDRDLNRRMEAVRDRTEANIADARDRIARSQYAAKELQDAVDYREGIGLATPREREALLRRSDQEEARRIAVEGAGSFLGRTMAAAQGLGTPSGQPLPGRERTEQKIASGQVVDPAHEEAKRGPDGFWSRTFAAARGEGPPSGRTQADRAPPPVDRHGLTAEERASLPDNYLSQVRARRAAAAASSQDRRKLTQDILAGKYDQAPTPAASSRAGFDKDTMTRAARHVADYQSPGASSPLMQDYTRPYRASPDGAGVYRTDVAPDGQAEYGKAIYSDSAYGATRQGLDEAIAKHGQGAAGPRDFYDGVDVRRLTDNEFQRLRGGVKGRQQGMRAAQAYMALPADQRGRPSASVQRAMAGPGDLSTQAEPARAMLAAAAERARKAGREAKQDRRDWGKTFAGQIDTLAKGGVDNQGNPLQLAPEQRSWAQTTGEQIANLWEGQTGQRISPTLMGGAAVRAAQQVLSKDQARAMAMERVGDGDKVALNKMIEKLMADSEQAALATFVQHLGVAG